MLVVENVSINLQGEVLAVSLHCAIGGIMCGDPEIIEYLY